MKAITNTEYKLLLDNLCGEARREVIHEKCIELEQKGEIDSLKELKKMRGER